MNNRIKKPWIVCCLMAAFLVSCNFDIGSFDASKKLSDTYDDPFEEIDFLANANPLVFGTSTKSENNSIVLGGNLDVPEGMIEVRSVSGSGKIAGSEDCGAFYFKEVEAGKNFIMEADFTVKSFGAINSGVLGSNGQEGWGILVHDYVPQYVAGKKMDNLKNTPLTGRNSAAYHLGSAGGESNMMFVGGVKRGVRAYWREGIKWNPENPLTNGDTGNSTTQAVQNVGNFRFDYAPRELGDYSLYLEGTEQVSMENRPDFPRWETTWKLRLEKTNNGFVYTITPPQSAMDRNIRLKSPVFTEPLTGTVPLYDITDSVNKANYYVGLFASRDACVWVSNIKYWEADAAKCAPELPFTPNPFNAVLEVVSPNFYTGNDYLYVTATVKGSLLVTQDGKQIPSSVITNEWIVEKNNGSGKPRTLFTIPTLPHKDGDNNFSLIFYPESALAPEIGSQYALASAAPIRKNFTVTKKFYNGGTGDIWVSPNGSPFGSGSSGSPLDIKTAIACVQPGQTISLQDGNYIMEELISIPRYNNGRKGKEKIMKAEHRDQVFFDWNKNIKLTGKGQGFLLGGNYWILDGFHIRNTPDKTKGMVVGGKNNIVRWVVLYNNGDTGLQISGENAEPKVFWPSGNRIKYCESFNNRDEAEIDADGFAAKLTAGEDNEFWYCISHNNCDDGWDLFTKKDTGTIGRMKLYYCISYENGTMLDGSPTKGGKNGFKMGGEGIGVVHELHESLSFRNGGNAITSNSNPALMVYNCTAVDMDGTANGKIYIYSGDSTVSVIGAALNCISDAFVAPDTSSPKLDTKVDSTDYESILIERTVNGMTYKKFIDRDVNGKPVLDAVYKSKNTEGAQVLYN